MDPLSPAFLRGLPGRGWGGGMAEPSGTAGRTEGWVVWAGGVGGWGWGAGLSPEGPGSSLS